MNNTEVVAVRAPDSGLPLERRPRTDFPTYIGPATHLAEDDPVWPHTQAVLDQITHGDFTGSFKVRRPCFKTYDMRLLQLQLCCVLAGNGPLAFFDEGG